MKQLSTWRPTFLSVGNTVLLTVLAFVVVGCGGPAPDKAAEVDFAPKLELYLGDVMEKFGIPGMTVAVTRGDDVVYTGAFGVRDLNTGEPMKPEYIFHMGAKDSYFFKPLKPILKEISGRFLRNYFKL